MSKQMHGTKQCKQGTQDAQDKQFNLPNSLTTLLPSLPAPQMVKWSHCSSTRLSRARRRTRNKVFLGIFQDTESVKYRYVTSGFGTRSSKPFRSKCCWKKIRSDGMGVFVPCVDWTRYPPTASKACRDKNHVG